MVLGRIQEPGFFLALAGLGAGSVLGRMARAMLGYGGRGGASSPFLDPFNPGCVGDPPGILFWVDDKP